MCELPEDHNGRTSHNQQTIMLTKAYSLISYELDSLDGNIGKVKDFYFDDRLWKIRYLIVDIGQMAARQASAAFTTGVIQSE
jgi:uncharacterized protein YrrD